MELLTNPNTWIALVTLTTLEIVLGIDNIVFISILAGKLPLADQERARRTGRPARGDGDADPPPPGARLGHRAHAAAFHDRSTRRSPAGT